MFRLRPQMCERAREWTSLRLDGELSELEGILFDAHLRRCSACTAYLWDVDAVTAMIRTTALEPVPQPVAVPVRRRRAYGSRGLQAGAAAAAVLAVTVGLGTQLPSPGRSLEGGASAAQPPAGAISGASDSESDWLVKLPRLANLKASFGSVRQGRLWIDT